ncbi:formimidoylglutamase [Rheinheimera sp. MMS21-TC3]|uniref:formimidoylglutamase n=1 Tax=Rheinheimera sp. MMS21-TC3 TaxID=3072790 RepID=UPI0028C39999|nr:formimidoylglutamase [Rheinheimera sp. MMS21-TC3]WNO60467.1 formimidoylglutamase [Rheinheimera sp. MMS21-TC3]
MLKLFAPEQLSALCQTRAGEQRLGQQILLPNSSSPLAEQLQESKQQGCRYVLVGISEDIGPRANLGAAGASAGWTAFLAKFLNLQSNDFINAKQILLLGDIDCSDLQAQASELKPNVTAQLEQLRQLVEIIDQRVEQVVAEIFAAELYPIVIGGGHNNSYPIISALAKVSQQPVNCANLDPHSDFRALEGRHSGNGFSYAWQQQKLQHYFVLGLHELKNSAANLALMAQAGAEFISYQQIFVRQQYSYNQALSHCIDSIVQGNNAIGIEVDTDSISSMPVSAFTNCGVSVSAAEQFVFQLAKLPRSQYLHLAEAAPSQHPAGLAAGMNEAGQVLAALTFAFIQGKQQQPPIV